MKRMLVELWVDDDTDTQYMAAMLEEYLYNYNVSVVDHSEAEVLGWESVRQQAYQEFLRFLKKEKYTEEEETEGLDNYMEKCLDDTDWGLFVVARNDIDTYIREQLDNRKDEPEILNEWI